LEKVDLEVDRQRIKSLKQLEAEFQNLIEDERKFKGITLTPEAKVELEGIQRAKAKNIEERKGITAALDRLGVAKQTEATETNLLETAKDQTDQGERDLKVQQAGIATAINKLENQKKFVQSKTAQQGIDEKIVKLQ